MSKTSNRIAEEKAEEELRANPINQFTCCNKVIPAKDFKQHLLEVHGVEKAVGKKTMIAHLDGSYWFSWNYSWELENGLKFTQYTEQARAKGGIKF